MSSSSRRLRSASTTCRHRRGSVAARSRRGAWGARSAVRTGLGVAASLRVRPKSGSVTETALSATKGQSGPARRCRAPGLRAEQGGNPRVQRSRRTVVPGQRSHVSARPLVLAMWQDLAGDEQTRCGAALARPRAAAPRPRPDRPGVRAAAGRRGARPRRVHVGRAFGREFRLAYGESPYGCLMTRRIERAMALLRRGDRSVIEVCFAVGCSSPGTFSSRFTELVGVPPSVYRRHAARATAGMPSCVAKQVTRPIRHREAPSPCRS